MYDSKLLSIEQYGKFLSEKTDAEFLELIKLYSTNAEVNEFGRLLYAEIFMRMSAAISPT